MINDDLGQMRIGAMLPMGIPGMSTPLTNAMMASAAAAYASQLQAAFSASTSFYAPHAGAYRSSADVTVNVNGTCATDDNTSMRNHYFASPNGDPVSAAATFAHRMMMYQRTAYGTLGQYYASEARAIRDARGTYAQSHMNQTTNRNAAQLVAAGECARGRASIAGVGKCGARVVRAMALRHVRASPTAERRAITNARAIPGLDECVDECGDAPFVGAFTDEPTMSTTCDDGACEKRRDLFDAVRKATHRDASTTRTNADDANADQGAGTGTAAPTKTRWPCCWSS